MGGVGELEVMPGEIAPQGRSAAGLLQPLALSRGRWVEAGADSLGVKLSLRRTKDLRSQGSL